jgi:lysyl-tRNA synthetase class 1
MTRESWPFLEARRILASTADKDEVVFECGYGPSGLPHIGTFGEVARTTMVRHAFRQLSNKPTRLIVFSDDMDALRKVPENVPNQEMLQEHLGRPLTSIPDPFGSHQSFAHHNNALLRTFLDSYGFDYEFMSATECYKSGLFNDTLVLLSQYLEEIKDIVTQGYSAARKNSYCPFLPIHNGLTHHDVFDWVAHSDGLPEPFLYWFKNKRIEDKLDDRIDVATPILNGNVKCQWKVDWPMRWIALGVDYEMHGKDLLDSASVGQKICRLLKKKQPVTFMYELFLDENGEKISKSKGNGLDLSHWWHYSTRDVLSYFMFQNPRKSRKLHFKVIPSATDDYLKAIDAYNLDENEDNPVWHVHETNVPPASSPVNFAMLLNLVSITNTSDPKLIWKYIQTYCPTANAIDYPILDALVARAINYYEDIILPNKVYRVPTERECSILNALSEAICNCEPTENALTIAVYDVGKKYYTPEELKNFFIMVYEVIMGQPTGPRLPVFITLFGPKNMATAIKQALGS